MAGFHRTNAADPEAFIKGAARVLSSPYAQTFPSVINDIIKLATGVTQYDPQSGWTDLGATKTGIQIVRNNTEETYDVDQIMGEIGSEPTNWEMNVGTALAEVTLEHIAYVWEGGNVTTNTTPNPDEKILGIGMPVSYVQRRLAVLFPRPNGNIRAYVFRKVQRQPQESSFTHAKTGEQATLPIRWRCLADDTVADVDSRFGTIFDQVS